MSGQVWGLSGWWGPGGECVRVVGAQGQWVWGGEDPKVGLVGMGWWNPWMDLRAYCPQVRQTPVTDTSAAFHLSLINCPKNVDST